MCVYNSSWNRRFRFHEKTFISFRYLERIELLSKVNIVLYLKNKHFILKGHHDFWKAAVTFCWVGWEQISELRQIVSLCVLVLAGVLSRRPSVEMLWEQRTISNIAKLPHFTTKPCPPLDLDTLSLFLPRMLVTCVGSPWSFVLCRYIVIRALVKASLKNAIS